MLPWFLPGVVISIVVSIAASGALGRALGVRRAVAWAIVISLGIIAAATLAVDAVSRASRRLRWEPCRSDRLGSRERLRPVADLTPGRPAGRVRLIRGRSGGQRGRRLPFERDHVLRRRPALSGTRKCVLTASSV